MESRVCRIAVFYDGTYFNKVSNYYFFQHERRARLSLKGLHEFIVAEVSRSENVEARHCQIIEACYFRGRLTAQQALEQDKLFSERVFEDVLMRADVTLHQQHVMTRPDGTWEEKRIDVWLALEAYEMASMKRYDVCVLLTGDGDFVPLVRKLHTLGARVMLLGWDFEYEHEGKMRRTRVSAGLIDQVNYPVAMDKVIDARERRNDPLVNGLFMPNPGEYMGRTAAPADGPPPEPVDDAAEQRGTLVNLLVDKGFGFIRPDTGGDNVFFHHTELREVLLADLQPNALLRYFVTRTERGLVARDVRLAPETAAE
jgi:uncharacterized LabA/DUF88 family protein/cold shock CspA family protein